MALTRWGILQYLPDEPFVGDSLCWYGEVLQPQLDLLARIARPGATVVEIGSGVGAHTIPLASMVGSDGHLLAYESQPVKSQILRQNLAANRISNVTMMRRPASGASIAHAAGLAANESISTPAETFPSETVDDLHLSRLDLLKIGPGVNAADVLAGAATTLWRLRPSIFVAAPDDAALTASAMHLREFGFRCWRTETPWFDTRNFNGRTDDVLAGRTALGLVATPEEMDVEMAQDRCVEIS